MGGKKKEVMKMRRMRTALLVAAMLSLVLVSSLVMTASASPPITWSILRTYSYNGNQILIVAKGGYLYIEVDIYKYVYTASGWFWRLISYFTVQASTTWYGTAKVTASAYLCYNGYCYPVKTWESSVNAIVTYLQQYLQNFFAAMCSYTNCWSLATYVRSLLAPYTMSNFLGVIGGISFIYLVYSAVPLILL
jgi:hypothetical protein